MAGMMTSTLSRQCAAIALTIESVQRVSGVAPKSVFEKSHAWNRMGEVSTEESETCLLIVNAPDGPLNQVLLNFLSVLRRLQARAGTSAAPEFRIVLSRKITEECLMVQATSEKIVEYYDERVSEYGTTGQSTLLDDNMRLLEVETVQRWLEPTDNVLEVFCGNGVSTLEFAGFCRQILACDLSGKMIEAANENLRGRMLAVDNVTFRRLDILNLEAVQPAGPFSAVVSVRGLINLPSWEIQQEAILKIRAALPAGGKFILIEGSRDGLGTINKMRSDASLKPIAEPWYNNFLEEQRFSEFMDSYFSIRDERSLDIYLLVSRVLYPSASFPIEPEFRSLCNTVARLLVPHARSDPKTALVICRCYIKK